MQGSGPVGLNAAIFAQLAAALRVFVIGAPRARLAAALKIGAEDVCNIRRHATVLGCWGYEFTHLHRSLEMLARHKGRFRWRDLISREYRLADAASALADMEKLGVVKALIRP